MENPRTTSARDHDDHELIDAASELPTPGQSGEAGHALAHEVAAEAEEDAVREPDEIVRATKQDDIDSNTAYRADRR